MIEKRSLYSLIIFLALGVLVVTVLISGESYGLDYNREIRIGYFHGGRVFVPYRAYVYDSNTHLMREKDEKYKTNYFEQEGVNVKLYSQNMLEDDWSEVPKHHEDMILRYGSNLFGKVTGTRIIEAVDEGILDGGTPGESSFVQKVVAGSPMVAVALLGHDTNEAPGKIIVLRNDLIINSPEDFKGKVFGTRRAGPGDRIILSEFFKSIGLDPETDVIIQDQVPDNEQIPLLKSGKLDGGLFHLLKVPKVIAEDVGYIYRTMDWMNAEVSHALLVFRKDFIEEYPEEVQKIVTAYVKRIKYESSIPEKERRSLTHPGDNLGLQLGFQLEGSSIPVYDYPPLVRMELLQEVQDLLFEYGEIDRKIDLAEVVDNSFVERAVNKIEY